LKKTAFLQSVEINRNFISKNGVKSQLITVDLDEALKGAAKDNIILKDMDEVVVRRIPEWKEETDRYVTLRGEVYSPGDYPIHKGEKLSSVIRRAGGYTERAYLKGAKFNRKSVADMQQKRMDEVISRTDKEIAQKQQELASVAASKEELEAAKTALASMKMELETLKRVKAEGRISLSLAPLDELQDSHYDLVLQGGDALEIPQSKNSIIVIGEVYNPTTVIQIPDKNVDYYLKKAGGVNQNANDDEMYVIRADGTVVSKQEMSYFLFCNNFMSMKLDAGDTIVVPQQMEKIAWMRGIKDIATILGQVALTAGVVVAAGL
jgi:protein involved in polysaccharide export with SLBB domain